MNYIKDFISNKYIACAIVSWFIAQFIKIVIELLKKNKFKTKEFILRALFGTGGMPSSHSATISSICMGIGLKEGFNSPLFALSFIIVFIVVRDATGVRLSSGKQAATINNILNVIHNKLNIETKFPKLKEVKGHTFLECLVGIIIGIVVSLGIFLT